MPEAKVSLQTPTRELRKNGDVVGETDRVYDINGTVMHIGEILVRGDLSGPLSYNGRMIEIVSINEAIGMLVDERGARGPVWKDVDARIVA